MDPLEPAPLEEIEAARARLAGIIPRTPLLRLNAADVPGEIYLKLENLQPIGSFKVRGAGNAMLLAGPARLAAGVYTASAGNMAQGVAWHARRLGIACSAVVPDHAPQA
jgi:threonine dehydratase